MAPFDVAVAVMAVGAVLVWYTWPENYGSFESRGILGHVAAAGRVIVRDPKVACLGAVQVYAANTLAALCKTCFDLA